MLYKYPNRTQSLISVFVCWKQMKQATICCSCIVFTFYTMIKVFFLSIIHARFSPLLTQRPPHSGSIIELEPFLSRYNLDCVKIQHPQNYYYVQLFLKPASDLFFNNFILTIHSSNCHIHKMFTLLFPIRLTWLTCS